MYDVDSENRESAVFRESADLRRKPSIDWLARKARTSMMATQRERRLIKVLNP